MEVDRFATCFSTQLPHFYSWRADPEAVATDAFSQAWRGKAAFAHPPWCLIARTLQKVKLEGATLVLITPLWKAQPWFPLILEMLIDLPLLLPVGKDTLHPSPNCDCPLTTNNQLQLVAWRVSADSSKQENFRAKQLSLSCARGERKRTLIITLRGRSGAGTEVSVPFLQISKSVLEFLTVQFEEGRSISELL